MLRTTYYCTAQHASRWNLETSSVNHSNLTVSSTATAQAQGAGLRAAPKEALPVATCHSSDLPGILC